MGDTAEANGTVRVYQIPSELGGGSIGIRKLTVSEWLDANRVSKDLAQLGIELAKRSVCLLNGRRVEAGGDVELERWWKALDIRVIQLVISAYAEVGNPTAEQQKYFFDSAREIPMPPLTSEG